VSEIGICRLLYERQETLRKNSGVPFTPVQDASLNFREARQGRDTCFDGLTGLPSALPDAIPAIAATNYDGRGQKRPLVNYTASIFYNATSIVQKENPAGAGSGCE
jgi:hypothetical protein